MAIDLSYAGMQAARLLQELGITSPPIDPWDIVRRLQEAGEPLQLVEQEQDGFEGCTVRHGKKAAILLNSGVAYRRRRKFTLSHELGHYRIASHQGQFRCLSGDIESPLGKRQEQEANEFASELILPSGWIYEYAGNATPSVALAGEVGELCEASLTASCLKLVTLCDEECAVVLSERGRVKWVYRSKRWETYIPADCPLDPRTAAARYFQGKDLPVGPCDVPVKAWMPSAKVPDDTWLLEDAVALPLYEQVLSLIHAPEEVLDDEW